MATEQERQHLARVRDEHLQAIQRLEVQAAAFGPLYTPPYLVEELEQRQAAVQRIDELLQPPRLADAVIAALPPDEQRLYLIRQVNSLETQVALLAHTWSRRLRRLVIAFAVCQALQLLGLLAVMVFSMR